MVVQVVNLTYDVYYTYVLSSTFQNPLFIYPAQILSFITEFTALLPFFLIVYYLTRRFEHLLALAALSIAGAVSVSLKYLIRRERPLFFEYSDNGFSFPSVHATTTFAAALVLSRYHPKYTFLFYSLASLTTLSRLILGLHFISDLFAGVSLGLLIGTLVLRYKNIFKPIHKKGNAGMKIIMCLLYSVIFSIFWWFLWQDILYAIFFGISTSGMIFYVLERGIRS